LLPGWAVDHRPPLVAFATPAHTESGHLCIETFGERLDEVALRTGDDGVFRVRVGDELVSDKHEHGPYDPDEVVRAARARL